MWIRVLLNLFSVWVSCILVGIFKFVKGLFRIKIFGVIVVIDIRYIRCFCF